MGKGWISVGRGDELVPARMGKPRCGDHFVHLDGAEVAALNFHFYGLLNTPLSLES